MEAISRFPSRRVLLGISFGVTDALCQDAAAFGSVSEYLRHVVASFYLSLLSFASTRHPTHRWGRLPEKKENKIARVLVLLAGLDTVVYNS